MKDKIIKKIDDKIKIPKHIGIILDGNRRYAKQIGKNSIKGHYEGAKTLKVILKYLYKKGLEEITLYTFSTENFKRSEIEKNSLMKLFFNEFDKSFKEDELKKDGIKINFIGNITLFPKEIQKLCKNKMKLTKNNNKFIINFAFGYGGREEIINAIKKISKDVILKKIKPNEIDENKFKNYLYLKNEPELIIRTGNRKRISNFLLWQSAYSEWFFEEKMWPEMKEEDFERIFYEFSKRIRTFGK